MSVKRKKPSNLSLSTTAKRQGNALKKPLKRNSLTNVVECLIDEKYNQIFKGPTAPVPATTEKAA